ncbi:MAG TPA: phage tail protein [Thermoanaerobaculia bacterium]|nr:phage tail protein [Thermoanaerobaculia bacterium]
MGTPYAGQVAAFVGGFVPSGWLACDGRLLPNVQYPRLYQVIGNKYGGGGDKFALPKLADPLNGVRYVIDSNDMLPPPDGPPPWAPDVIGMTVQWSAPMPPGNLSPNGQLLSIAEYATLFMLVGTKFGGDGQSSFAVPNLGGNWVLAFEGRFPMQS